MIVPPAVLRVRIVEHGRRKVALWIPIFVIWPALVHLAVVSVPLIPVLFAVGLFFRNVRVALQGGWHLFQALCALRGLRVEVRDDEEDILVHIT